MSSEATEEKSYSTDSYTIKKVIGEGSYGRAMLCEDKETKIPIVVKEISFANLSAAEQAEARKETSVLALLHHPNIIGYRGCFMEKKTFHIVMDFADGGDLGEKIEQARGVHFKEDEILHWFVQICLAIKHVHDRKILHRDLKTQNIFLMKNGIVKLGDFGIAKVLDQTGQFTKTSIGTPYYLSPEICQGRAYNNKSDIWALGCVLYELCTLKHPFDSNCMNGLIMKILRSKQAPIPSFYSTKLKNLVDNLLMKAPSKRPNINQILQLDLLQERIGNLLSSTMQKIEFSHTIFHGAKGGETPAEFDPKKVSQIPVRSDSPKETSPKTSSRAASSKATSSPTKKASVAPARNAPPSRGKPALATKAPASNGRPTTAKQSVEKQKQEAAAAERNALREEKKRKEEEDRKRDEIQKKKRAELEKKHKERQAEIAKQQELLKKEERERKKKYENLEAPFKKTKGMTAPKAQNDDPLFIKIEENEEKIPRSASRPASNEMEFTKRPKSEVKKRDQHIENIRAVISAKRAEMKKTAKAQSDTIQIGNVEVPIADKAPEKLEDIITIVDDDDDKQTDELVTLAAIAQDLCDQPIDASEADDDEDEDNAVKFMFRGQELDLGPKDESKESQGSRIEALRQFLEKGLGLDKFLAAYRFMTDSPDDITQEESDAQLKKILTTNEELDYFPLIQQLVVCEGALESDE